MGRTDASERVRTDAERRLIEAMERYADGDAAAFTYVYTQLAPPVRRCLVRWVGDPELAHDLVQETFLRVHRARDRYLTGAPVGPWVLTIARRLSIDALRARGRSRERTTREGELPEPLDTEPADTPTPQWLIDEVRTAIEALPESQRVVVSAHKLAGRPLADIARDLDIQEGAARVRAHRGYQRLKAALAEAFQRHRGPEA